MVPNAGAVLDVTTGILRRVCTSCSQLQMQLQNHVIGARLDHRLGWVRDMVGARPVPAHQVRALSLGCCVH